ncbi:TPA: DUF968 domain-containing protein [Escherichia coli]|nr:DUF968 domain-containing protein [Escherichia coli]HEL8043854.1 DUF968 domain-containing protein [Escherichia coli]HEL8126151.1 DUF968 domain-containing protein [Escherichia coli]HEL8735671.1 DUF968 domain-containing protein [Escherichia coli]HEM0086381.1 DUF968 domain-containing protein [Escherichia coli]
MPLFMQGRVLLEPEPERYSSFASGAVPAASQPLADDPAVRAVFRNEAVIRRAGGVECLESWLLREKGCQWPHSDWHSENITTMRHAPGAIRLCWHCDNQLCDQTSESLGQLAQQNLTAWMIDAIRHAISGTQERELSLAELCWWAACNQVVDALPEAVSRRALGLPIEKIRSVYRESDIVPGELTATSIMKQRTKNIVPSSYAHQRKKTPQEKTVVSITVDPESPAQYLQRQKPQREEMPRYTRWVKTQKCMTCGNQADDPHHIIGHGLGGMGTKADDLFVIPLCRKCHNGLHAGVKEFEEKHGSQLLLLIRFLIHARNSGVLKWKA